MRTWTEAAKAAQRIAIRKWKPWRKSTGPRTAAGKLRSARNAGKGDTLPKLTRDLARLGARQMRLFRLSDQLDRLDLPGELAAKRTIMQARISAEIGRLADETTAWFWRVLHVTFPRTPKRAAEALAVFGLRPEDIKLAPDETRSGFPCAPPVLL